jgi:hypothetical protein
MPKDPLSRFATAPPEGEQLTVARRKQPPPKKKAAGFSAGGLFVIPGAKTYFFAE